MDKPLLSVIIPFYNAEERIERCLRSIMAQTYGNLEIICMNDGSTDHGVDIIKELSDTDKRIHLYEQEHKGVLKTRKNALKYAKGDYVAWVDSDDWIESNMYEQLMKGMIENRLELITSGLYFDTDTGDKRIKTDYYEAGLYDKQRIQQVIYPTMLYDPRNRCEGLIPSLCNKIFLTKILNQIYSLVDENISYGDDNAVIYPYVLLCNKIFILDKVFYHYDRTVDVSICKTKEYRNPGDIFLQHSVLKRFFIDDINSEVLMRQLNQYVLMILLGELQLYCGMNLSVFDQWEIDGYDKIGNGKVVIYGAGALGQALYNKIYQDFGEDKITALVDREPEVTYNQKCFPVTNFESIFDKDFDFIIIAINNKAISDDVRGLLLQRGIEEDKIICISGKRKNRLFDFYWNEDVYSKRCSTLNINLLTESDLL